MEIIESGKYTEKSYALSIKKIENYLRFVSSGT
jgi:hypothetical protein